MSKTKDAVIDDQNRINESMKHNYSMHCKVLNALIEKVKEESLPVNIQAGKIEKDHNGDQQVNVCLEYDDNDADVINNAICASINKTFNLI